MKSNEVFTCLGASNQALFERQSEDFYATEPKSIDLLLEQEVLHNVWECCCGLGHMSERLNKYVTWTSIFSYSYLCLNSSLSLIGFSISLDIVLSVYLQTIQPLL